MTTGREYPHAMLREIFEQPEALQRTLESFTDGVNLREEAFGSALSALAGRESMLIAASGSSRHAGLVGEVLLEDFAGMPVDVEYASEYIYRSTQTMRSPCFLVLSQSGETADTLEALREARARGASTIAITNNERSTMARGAHCSLPTRAGTERAVPATKSFTTQLLVLNLLALYAARVRGRMTAARIEAHLEQIRELPTSLNGALTGWEEQVEGVARRLVETETYLFLGRGIHFPIAREGALKLKESAYAQAEGYPAGELKHGPNALVGQSATLVALATKDPHSADSLLRYRKTLQLLRDMKAQGARAVAVASEGDETVPGLCDEVVFVPSCPEHLTPILEVVPLQMLAYFTAVGRGIDVDRPRNLVKAVVRE